jgi:hypothetical protein
MGNKASRFTGMERKFVEIMARVNDAVYAADKAGYKHPDVQGHQIAARPHIRDATFASVQKFLRDQGAAIGVYTLAELAIDEKMPAGVRRAAAADLAKLSGVGVEDQANGKELHEMSLDELRANAQKLERQRDAMMKAISDQAKPIVEHEDDVFG